MPNPYEPSAVVEIAPPTADALARGKLIAWLIIGTSLGASLLTMLYYLAILGPDRLPIQLTRFAISVALCYGFYSGRAWVRYVMIVLAGFAVISSLVAILLRLERLSLVGFMLLAGLGIVYGGGAIVMMFSRSLLAFLNDQAARRA